jgi:uncharacterized membrane protein YeaQ/YmgE (transglycosylase-associated protein family)
MSLIWFLVVGLIAGAIARLVVPGRDPLGFFGTILLGLVGSVLGGLVVNQLIEGDQDFSPAGLIGSILGAIVALLIWRWFVARRGSAPTGGM